MTHVKITSSFTNDTWEGEVDLVPTDDTMSEDDTTGLLGAAWNFFQRTDEESYERLDALGYKLPSLSAGDRIELDGEAWKVEPVGFALDTRDPDKPIRPWPLEDELESLDRYALQVTGEQNDFMGFSDLDNAVTVFRERFETDDDANTIRVAVEEEGSYDLLLPNGQGSARLEDKEADEDA